jgi:prevent-host-death family protein
MSSSDIHQGIEAARKNLRALLERANRGQTVVITKRGRPFAAIVPVDRAMAKNSGISLSRLRGTGKGMWGRNAAAWAERLRSEW